MLDSFDFIFKDSLPLHAYILQINWQAIIIINISLQRHLQRQQMNSQLFKLMQGVSDFNKGQTVMAWPLGQGTAYTAGLVECSQYAVGMLLSELEHGAMDENNLVYTTTFFFF